MAAKSCTLAAARNSTTVRKRALPKATWLCSLLVRSCSPHRQAAERKALGAPQRSRDPPFQRATLQVSQGGPPKTMITRPPLAMSSQRAVPALQDRSQSTESMATSRLMTHTGYGARARASSSQYWKSSGRRCPEKKRRT